MTALSATADDVRRTYPGRPVFVITRPTGCASSATTRCSQPEEADGDDARAAAVILGDGAEDLSYATWTSPSGWSAGERS